MLSYHVCAYIRLLTTNINYDVPRRKCPFFPSHVSAAREFSIANAKKKMPANMAVSHRSRPLGARSER